MVITHIIKLEKNPEKIKPSRIDIIQNIYLTNLNIIEHGILPWTERIN